ncbi:MAG: VCBS repeat-containing protein [Microscillaceae bacterium]|nr:VCBS repeat-containing protein [Microscillaceae bacterium]
MLIINMLFKNILQLFSYFSAWFFGILLLNLVACGEQKPAEPKLFEELKPEQTGISFVNKLTPTPELNIFKYLYYYNGGGVACGDFNGDNLPDIYFTANQTANQLYLNKGNFKFEDITETAGVAGIEDGWTTGVTIVDINADGKLDLYVSQLGNYIGIFGKNQLFINQGNDEKGVPTFKDEAKKYGLDLVGFSTQATFFDYDLDGDLDMYMLNHSVHDNGTQLPRDTLLYKKHKLAGDKLLQNNQGKYVEVTEKAGLYSSVIGYGLGVGVGDVNNDGYPDIYIGNDFHENDYLYINQKNGTFKEILQTAMAHTSRYSMGNDIGDINNDGLMDIVSMDMLPEDYKILKASQAEDPLNVYNYKLRFGYNHQFSRNTLQLNLGNNKFSEIGALSGVYATDWSWSALFADFDLDGWQDIFISNGIERRSNDLDYIKYISTEANQIRLHGDLTSKDLKLIESMPVIKLPNYLYRNLGNLQFENMAEKWGLGTPTIASGSAYADLDNDGDLDLVANNTGTPASVYKNLTREIKKENNYLKIRFKGDSMNTLGIGARVLANTKKGIMQQELYTTRGFQSAVNPEIIMGLGDIQSLDSLVVIWANHRYQVLKNVKANQTLILEQKNALSKYKFPSNELAKPLFQDISDSLKVDFVHLENDFIEFNREALIPHTQGSEGPALAVGDVNGDGKVDFYTGGAKHQSGMLHIQTNNGFDGKELLAFRQDSIAEDVKAEFLDVDNDKDLDLIVLSGGNEFWGKAEPNRPRLYLNDGKGDFSKNKEAFAGIYLTGGALATADFDKDGDVDIFIGARALPNNYGKIPDSYLLVNDGKGNFKEITPQTEGLKQVGLVKSAAWGDLDKNGYPDLVVVGDWMPITIFMNEKGKLNKLSEKTTGLAFSNGFWNTVAFNDIDGDGDLDMIAGNYGLNSRLKASQAEPLCMYVDDFDKNGQIEQLLFHYHQGKKRLFMTKDEITKQLVSLNKTFVTYKAFAEANEDQVIEPAKLKKADLLQVYEMRSCVIKNEGNNQFALQPLPLETQFSTINALIINDFNKDGIKDIFTAGNFYEVNIQMGRHDASYGNLLLNDKKGNLTLKPNREINLFLSGQIRNMAMFDYQGKKVILLARNKSTVRFLKINP